MKAKVETRPVKAKAETRPAEAAARPKVAKVAKAVRQAKVVARPVRVAKAELAPPLKDLTVSNADQT